MQDVRLAARLFRRQPSIVALTVVGLAIAIGLTTTVLTLVDATVLRRFGIVDPKEAYVVGDATWAYADFLKVKETVSSLALAGYRTSGGGPFRRSLVEDRENLPSISLAAVSGNFMTLAGARAALGRTLAPEDDTPDADRTLVLSDWYWTTRLGRDAGVVGSAVWINNIEYHVVGVMAPAFRGLADGTPSGGWITLAASFRLALDAQAADVAHAKDLLRQLTARGHLTTEERARAQTLRAEIASPPRFYDYVSVIGRVRGGASRAQAQAEVSAVARRVATAAGRPVKSDRTELPLRALSELAPQEISYVRSVLVLVAFMFVLACANVTNVLLASAVSRAREIGTRLALGATRARIRRQLLTESVLLGCGGAAGGLVLALWITPVLARLLNVPAGTDVSPRLGVYALAAGLALLTSAIAGLAPARRGARGDILSALNSDHTGTPTGASPRQLRSMLVTVQTAAAVIVLLMAALYTRAIVRASGLDLGADVPRLVNVDLEFNSGEGQAAERAYIDAARDRLTQIPGIAGVSRVRFPLFGHGAARVTIASRPKQEALRNAGDATLFATLGTPVLRGRTFTTDEIRSGAPVAVITASLARDLWGAADPIGDSMERIWGADDPPGTNRENWIAKPTGTRIIGIVGDTVRSTRELHEPTVYIPIPDTFEPIERLVVRVTSDRDATTMIRTIHDALRPLGSDITRTVESSYARYQGELDRPRSLAMLAAALGTSALILALIGLFGVTAFAAAERRREVSIRVALGATAGSVIRLLMRQALWPVVLGLIAGIALSSPAIESIRHFLWSDLFGLSVRDPIATSTAVAVLLAAAAAAAWLPARRAARVAPAEVLKS